MARPKSDRIQTTMRLDRKLLAALGTAAKTVPGKYRSRSHFIEAELWEAVKRHRDNASKARSKERSKKPAHDVLG